MPLFGQTTQTASTTWEIVAWIALGVAFVCAGAMLWDVLVRGYRQHMGIMNWVWPINALYWGLVALWFYARRGRRMSPKWAYEHRVDMEEMMGQEGEDPPGFLPFARKHWWPVSKGTAHCAPNARSATSARVDRLRDRVDDPDLRRP